MGGGWLVGLNWMVGWSENPMTLNTSIYAKHAITLS